MGRAASSGGAAALPPAAADLWRGEARRRSVPPRVVVSVGRRVYPSDMRLRGLAGAILAILAAVGCSHTYFQLRVSDAELEEIDQTRQALAASYRAPGALAQVVDLPGRRATETLLASLTLEQTNADEQYQRLMRALYIAVMGDASDPMEALQSDLSMTGLRVGTRVAAQTVAPLGLDGIVESAGAALLGDGDGQRLREMQVSLQRGQIETCEGGEIIVSYDADILGHIDAQMAERDADYRAWRDRVEAIHLLRLRCREGHVLMIMTRNGDEPGLRVIGWHFVSQRQWDAMAPRLRETFDLPR